MKNLLDEAVEKYAIPPWPYEAAYDRIVVFSVPEDRAARDTFIDGGMISKPDSRKKYEENSTPRGVIVSAGLGALDVLRSHMMGLGHMVWVARLSPWRHEVDVDKDGRPVEFLFLRVGDIVGSETLQRWIRGGAVHIGCDDNGVHRYETDGAPLMRVDPPSYVA